MVWQNQAKPFFVLAPMDDVTDTVFRRVVSSCGKPDIFFTEFVSVDGLMSPGRDALWKKLEFDAPSETPLIAQLWGLKPENYRAVARELAGLGFAGIDINMGCPVPVVIKNGACSALINNRQLASDIINATIEGAGDLPVSVKCRLGFNTIDLSWHEFLLGHKISALTVHGRTTKELSKVPNHWDEISKVVTLRDEIAPKTVIVGNGDVSSRAQGLDMAQQHGVDGIMIGRGVFHDPFVFAEHSPWQAMQPTDKIRLFQKHIQLFIETWGNKKNPASLKKFAKVYLQGFDGASDIRVSIMEQSSVEQMLELLLKATD
jgi:tRNA-dihydrouridine synthase